VGVGGDTTCDRCQRGLRGSDEREAKSARIRSGSGDEAGKAAPSVSDPRTPVCSTARTPVEAADMWAPQDGENGREQWAGEEERSGKAG
jgi:hypothetical protein